MIGLVPAWESSASIGRFKLRSSDDLFDSVSISEGRAVKAAQFVVEHSGESDSEMGFAGRKGSA